MDKENQDSKKQLKLPTSIVGGIDVARSLRELKALDESIYQAGLRRAGQPTKLAPSGPTIESLAGLNDLVLTNEQHRKQLIIMLESIYEHAPRVHISFASEPSSNFVANIVGWFRVNVSPVTLVDIGLQPSIAVGCVIRTTNKQFDMSLRKNLDDNYSLLSSAIAGVVNEQQ